MHLIVTIDLAGEAFRHGNIGSETARILHNSAERLATLHTKYGALSYENPEQLYLLDNAGAMVGYVSTVELDDITPAAQDRIAEHIAAAAGSTHPINRPPIRTTPGPVGGTRRPSTPDVTYGDRGCAGPDPTQMTNR